MNMNSEFEKNYGISKTEVLEFGKKHRIQNTQAKTLNETEAAKIRMRDEFSDIYQKNTGTLVIPNEVLRTLEHGFDYAFKKHHENETDEFNYNPRK